MFLRADHESPRFQMPAVFTLVLWGVCAVVCLMGIVMKAERFAVIVVAAPMPAPELISVSLTTDIVAEFPSADAQPAMSGSEAPRLEAPLPPEASAVLEPLQTVPAYLPLAAPAEIVFALPVDVPLPAPLPEPQDLAIGTSASDAAQSQPSDTVNDTGAHSVSVAPSRHLVFGQGQGRQPAPRYPESARRRNQTGSVRVRFTVGPDGYVTDAMTLIPCKYRLLNEAAVDTVRYRWRFPEGHRRVYEVDIRFELKE